MKNECTLILIGVSRAHTSLIEVEVFSGFRVPSKTCPRGIGTRKKTKKRHTLSDFRVP